MIKKISIKKRIKYEFSGTRSLIKYSHLKISQSPKKSLINFAVAQKKEFQNIYLFPEDNKFRQIN